MVASNNTRLRGYLSSGYFRRKEAKPSEKSQLKTRDWFAFFHSIIKNTKNYLMIFSLIRLPQYWFSEDSPTPPFGDFNPQFYYTPREKDPKNKTSGDLSFDQGTCSVNSVYPPRSLGFDLSRSFNSAVYVVGWSPWPSVESIYTKQNKTKQKIKENNQKVSKTGLLFVWINFTWNKQLILL